jgi:hypothetical protein
LAACLHKYDWNTCGAGGGDDGGRYQQYVMYFPSVNSNSSKERVCFTKQKLNSAMKQQHFANAYLSALENLRLLMLTHGHTTH